MKTLEQRFWNKVKKTPKCWLWKGSKGQSGHGQFWDGKRLVNAHRIAYEWNIGTIPKGLTIDHMCENPPCVNPAHLQAITMLDNVLLSSKAQNTHCVHGHPYEGNNLIWYRNFRTCRICKQDKDRRYHWRNRERINARKRAVWRRSCGEDLK